MKGIAWLKKCLAHPSLLPLTMADLEALLRSAQAALTTASETLPSAEERRAEAAAAESLAASGAGDVAKTPTEEIIAVLKELDRDGYIMYRDKSAHRI